MKLAFCRVSSNQAEVAFPLLQKKIDLFLPREESHPVISWILKGFGPPKMAGVLEFPFQYAKVHHLQLPVDSRFVSPSRGDDDLMVGKPEIV